MTQLTPVLGWGKLCILSSRSLTDNQKKNRICAIRNCSLNHYQMSYDYNRRNSISLVTMVTLSPLSILYTLGCYHLSSPVLLIILKASHISACLILMFIESFAAIKVCFSSELEVIESWWKRRDVDSRDENDTTSPTLTTKITKALKQINISNEILLSN